MIVASLSDFIVPIDAVTPHPENYRKGDIDAIAASLTRFGQVRPIIVQASTRHIVAGNHRYHAAVSLGWTEIAAAVVEMDDDEAHAYLLADNRLSDVAENDDEALVAILQKLTDDGRLEGTGYTPDDVDDILSALADLPEVPPLDAELPKAPLDPNLQKRVDEPVERKTGAGQLPHREIVLMLTKEQSELFTIQIKRLQGVHETTSTSKTVLAAVAAAAARADS